MTRKIVCCGILKKEIEYLLRGKDVELQYLDSALHVNLDKLEEAVKEVLNGAGLGVETPMIIGTNCHPEMERLVGENGGKLIQAKNCIEILLGDKMAEFDAESRNFYMTTGWLENWRQIFIEGLMWSEIDARQNFGFYDRIIMLDTGIVPIDEEQIIEFYDYTQVPVDIVPVGLDNLSSLLGELLEEG